MTESKKYYIKYNNIKIINFIPEVRCTDKTSIKRPTGLTTGRLTGTQSCFNQNSAGVKHDKPSQH